MYASVYSVPLSSMSSDAGVSSSFILLPSYRNLRIMLVYILLAIRDAVAADRVERIRLKFSLPLPLQQNDALAWTRGRATACKCHSPDAADILAHFRGIRALQLAQLGVPLDLEEHLLSCLGRHLHDAIRAPSFIQEWLRMSGIKMDSP